MLHFRFSTVLKELCETALKRPQSPWLAPNVLLPRSCSSSAAPVSADARRPASTPPRRLLHAAPPGLRCAPYRSYCVKTEGAVELDEQLKKDGGAGETGSDK